MRQPIVHEGFQMNLMCSANTPYAQQTGKLPFGLLAMPVEIQKMIYRLCGYGSLFLPLENTNKVALAMQVRITSPPPLPDTHGCNESKTAVRGYSGVRRVHLPSIARSESASVPHDATLRTVAAT